MIDFLLFVFGGGSCGGDGWVIGFFFGCFVVGLLVVLWWWFGGSGVMISGFVVVFDMGLLGCFWVCWLNMVVCLVNSGGV